MKKMLVLAIASVMFGGMFTGAIANAGPGERAKEMRDKAKTEKAREGAARVGKVSPEIAKVTSEVSRANLDANLASGQADALGRVLEADASLRTAAKEIVAMNASKPALAELGKMRIEGLLNVSKIDAKSRNLETEFNSITQKSEMLEQAYVALVMKAGSKAATMTPEVRKNVELLLTRANEQIRRGRSVSEAMETAKAELKKDAKVDIKLEDIKKLC